MGDGLVESFVAVYIENLRGVVGNIILYWGSFCFIEHFLNIVRLYTVVEDLEAV